MEVSTGFQAMSALKWSKICLDFIAMAKNQNICSMNYLIKVPQMAILYHIYMWRIVMSTFYFVMWTLFSRQEVVSLPFVPSSPLEDQEGGDAGPFLGLIFSIFCSFRGGGHTNRLEPQPLGLAAPLWEILGPLLLMYKHYILYLWNFVSRNIDLLINIKKRGTNIFN